MGIFPKRELIFPILWGSSSSYSYFPNTRITDLPIVSGEETVMMAALQSRNGARVLLSGSTDICANSLQTTFLGNKHFCSQIVSWTLGERGMLRTQNWRHHKVGQLLTNHSSYHMYRVEDEIEFLVDIEEWNGIEHRWKPFLGNDVQLEFIMLDPYIRKTLTCVDTTKGSYYTRFRIPDRIGVYKFSIEYYRRGYSPIQVSQVVSVRPFRHDEYERFILQAYPYYAAAFSMLFGVIIFGFVFLHGKGMLSIKHK
ncbi:Dolichyl-diphosphooligosaccharide--protein glycosyltransferase 48 kDa subunit [Galdieria sulphuraria]|nr:Dolichyl-diphosphooligosaccharide--protein glycosyltransferase 48 kDa subunit [Galdieria sulphuraria]